MRVSQLTKITKEAGTMMRQLAVALVVGALTLFGNSFSYAAEDHVAEALKHAEQAVTHGKMGHADVLVEHVQASLKHAEAAEKKKANPHTKAAIKSLKSATEHGK